MVGGHVGEQLRPVLDTDHLNLVSDNRFAGGVLYDDADASLREFPKLVIRYCVWGIRSGQDHGQQRHEDQRGEAVHSRIPWRLGGPATVEPVASNSLQPGEFPYTRGVHETMYRSRLWTMRQFAGFGSADDTNARFKYLLENAKGTKINTGLSTAFSLPHRCSLATISLPFTALYLHVYGIH